MRSFLIVLTLLVAGELPFGFAAEDSGNRFTILDEFCDIYYPDQRYPKLTTPQWVGEEGVEAVLVLAIDDMRDHKPYESYLRPILDRLKQIDGRAPASIMSCRIDPGEPHLQTWLAEGVSIETHTVDHPCPILDKGNLAAAKSTYDRCVDHFFTVPNNRPVAFRTPCMDGINSASPRLFSEVMLRTTEKGHYLTLSSSIGLVLTADDPENPKELVLDSAGRPRFNKYLLPGYINYIENYPYPYLIGNRFWETPFCVPDDYEASRVFGDRSPSTVSDMKAAIDAVVAKKGIWVMTFHPYAWIGNTQIIELIDHVVAKHGRKAKFLNLREVNERLEKNLLGGQGIRARNGSENGVRLLDLNKDGYLDVIVANDEVRQTRVWQPEARKWRTTEFPAALAAGVRFGVMDSKPCAYVSNEKRNGFWLFDGDEWRDTPEYLAGLELGGSKVKSSVQGRDRGVRFRDVNRDGACELLISNPDQNAIFQWSGKTWRKLEFGLPERVSIVTAEGLDNGVRFLDFNKDGNDDVIFSNEAEYGLWLNVPELFLGFKQGWSRQIMRGRRGDKPEIPMISRGGEFRNNGAWFASETMWVQNEDTTKMPDLVERVGFRDLLTGFQPPPREPKEALQSMQVGPDHRVELVAHEPAILDPVSFEWGADGTLWVVEMRDYPRGIEGRAGGVVTRLRDEDGDGFYESSSVFLNNLNYPNGVMPWKNGILISAAPDILFAEDVNQDGRADRTEVLFRGFREGNQQHRVNGFELGLDNWIHGANGDSGGLIENVKSGYFVPIAGRDFRFRPDSREFEATSGQTQYGKRRDDWGNWFGGANYTWGWHYFLPEEYLQRNPHLAVKSSHRTLNSSPEGTRVFSVSRVQQRFNDIGMAGHVTSACSFAPYRDELFGPEFEHSIFISEPTHNLVHREVLEPDGVSIKSHRAASEQGREFMASTDPWFRPTTVKTGPDGAIYVADMYRLVIEHPEWIPLDAQDRIDVRSGEDKGRIYRVRPKGAELRQPARLHSLSGSDLARAIDTPNGWQRDTVQRLLIESRAKEAVPILIELVRSNPKPKVRLQSLCTIDGLGALSEKVLLIAFKDEHPSVREHAIRLSEPFLEGPEIRGAVLALVNDPELRVRYQLALSLGASSSGKVPEALAKLVREDGENADMITAVISSSADHRDALLLQVLRSETAGTQVERLVSHLVERVAAENASASVSQATSELEKGLENAPGWKLNALARLLEADKKANSAKLATLAIRARDLAVDSGATERDRTAVLRLIADVDVLASVLAPGSSPSLQKAVVARLAQTENARVPDVLLARWKNIGPAIRNEIQSTLLRRKRWTTQMLGLVKAGLVQPADLNATTRQALLGHSSEDVREIAAGLFQPVTSERQELVAAMLPKLSSLSGDSARGRALFETHCAACHRAGQFGSGAGPNLAMLFDQTTETILTAVLDPNRAVEEKFWSYTVELGNGEEFTGILLNESGNSITLMGISGAEQTFLRRDIAGLNNSSRSMMPEGFEQFLQPRDFADLIAFVRGIK